MILTKPQAQLHTFTSKSDIHPKLQCVMTDGVTAVATDSFCLVEIKNNEAEASKPLMLPAHVLKALKFSKKLISPTAEVTADRLTTSEAIYMLPTPPVAEPSEFPQYKQIFPTATPKVTLFINATYLAEICTALSKLDPHAKVTLEVHGDLKPLVIHAEGSDHTARAMLMPLIK